MANNTLFGTDGVRGTAGRYPLDPPTVRRLLALTGLTSHPRIDLIEDVRATVAAGV